MSTTSTSISSPPKLLARFVQPWRRFTKLPNYDRAKSVSLFHKALLLHWLLIGIVLMLISSFSIGALIGALRAENALEMSAIAGLYMFVFVAAFLINRAGHYRVAAVIVICSVWLGPLISAYTFSDEVPEIFSLHWTSITSIVLTSALFPDIKSIALVGILNLTSCLGLYGLMGMTQPATLFGPVSTISVLTLYTIIIRLHRSKLETERRAELMTANHKLQQQVGEREQFAQGLTAILNASQQLMATPDLDMLWKRGIEIAREHLDVERCAIYQYQPTTETMLGTYGTDIHGHTIDERGKSFTIASSAWVTGAFTTTRDKPWDVKFDVNLLNSTNGEVVSKGWNAFTIISSHAGLPSAILFSDNAISGKPFDSTHQDLIGLYCSMLGGIVERKRAELQREDQQATLQATNELLRQQMEQHERLTTGLTRILNATDELMAAVDIDQLWKRGTELARELLGLDRNSIFEYDAITQEMIGTYGTDMAGKTVDERTKRFNIRKDPWLIDAMNKKRSKAWAVQHDEDLWEFRNGVDMVVAHGWLAYTVISNRAGLPAAIMFNDNSVSNRPFDVLTQDLVGVYCSLLGGIIERKRAEAQLEENIKELKVAKRMADESSRIKSEFLATVSHELRTPLNAIIGFSDMLLMGMSGELNPKQLHKMTRLRENGVRLLTLINNVLDLTRLEARRVEIINRPFSPRELVKRIAAQTEVLAQQKNLAFHIQIDPVIPTVLNGDEQRIEQVIVNLLSNAFKFTDAGSVTLNVRLDPVNNAWTLCVTDTGIGIPPHALHMIFEEFRQVDGSFSRTYKGSGLGLAITRNLIRLMNGHINVSSEIGKGSAFTISLPIVSKTTDQLGAQQLSTPAIAITEAK